MNIFTVIILLAIIGAGIYFFLKRQRTTDEEVEEETEVPEVVEGKPSQQTVQKLETETKVQEQTTKVPETTRKELPAEFKEQSIEELKSTVKKEIEELGNEYGMEFEETKELAQEVINMVDNAKGNIYNSLNSEDYETLEREIHGLKGATLNSKFNTIGKRFEYILNYIRSNGKSIDKNFLKELIDNTFKTHDKIKDIIENN